MVKELTEDNFKEETASGDVLVKFSASWCGPCKRLAPLFESAASATEGVSFGAVSVEDSRRLSQELGIRAVPTMILFRDGEEVARQMGGGQDDLDEIVAKATA